MNDNGPHHDGLHLKARGDGGNHAPFVPAPFDPNCPRNGRPLAAPAAWRAQARSIQSNNLTADALIAALATPHVNTVSPSLNVRGWVKEIASYLKDPHYVKLCGGSMGDVIEQCGSISHQQIGASFVLMVTLGARAYLPTYQMLNPV